MAEMTQKEKLEAAIVHLTEAHRILSERTKTTIDDKLNAAFRSAWANEWVRNFIVDRIDSMLGGNADAMALTSPEDAQALEALGFDLGTIITIIKWIEELYRGLFRK